MEEKKLSVELHKRETNNNITYKQDNDDPRLQFPSKEVSKYFGDGINDNWYELRFSSIGPDRRGYHSSF